MEAVIDIAILAVMVIMVRKNIHIGHVLFACSVLFGITHQVPLTKLAALTLTSASSGSALNLFGSLYLITLLERISRHSGSQSRLVTGVKNLSGNPRFALAALPAFIGLLPSPGGARFSAPMVEEAAKGVDISKEQAAAINYYYRHIWEYFLPLYPSSLLAVEILQISLNSFVLLMVPYAIVTTIFGLLLLRNIRPIPKETNPHPRSEAWKQVLEGVAPICTIMFLVLVFNVHILAALSLVNVAMFIYYKIGWKAVWPMLKASLEIRLLYIVFGALYLRDVMVISGSIEQLPGFFTSIGMTPLMITIVFPFSIGLLTGVSIPGITISLPLIIAMTGPDNLLSMASLGLLSNILGLLLSPIHLCFIMSVEHFSANFAKTYVKLLLPGALILIFAVFYSFII